MTDDVKVKMILTFPAVDGTNYITFETTIDEFSVKFIPEVFKAADKLNVTIQQAKGVSP